VIPIWRDAEASQANVTGGLLDVLIRAWATSCRKIFSRIATHYWPRLPTRNIFRRAYRARPAHTHNQRPCFIPAASRLGRRLIWLHSYGERFVPARQRPAKFHKATPVPVAACLTPPRDTPKSFFTMKRHKFCAWAKVNLGRSQKRFAV